MKTNAKIHFPGLNGIRAIAASTVLIFHIDQFISYFGLMPIGFHKTGMASYGVILFFVLSGYLITHLLLLEKEEFTKIDLPKFYIRRVLRIWPIYYAILLITLLIYFICPQLLKFPPDNTLSTFILYSCLLSNVGYGLGLGVTTIAPLWSVGVEEQFYAFWPFLLGKSKNILYPLLGLIAIYLSIKFSLKLFEFDKLSNLVNLCCFDCMAVGGIGAYLVNTKSKFLKIIYSPAAQIISWAALIISIFYKPVHLFSILDNELNSIFYIIIIMNVSSNPKTIINLEHKAFDFIGKISYGIYVYHVTIMVLLAFLLKNIFHYKLSNILPDYILVFSITIVSTILISYLSYTYFESFFLKRKHKYTKIESVSKM